jgi:hypothetical protein
MLKFSQANSKTGKLEKMDSLAPFLPAKRKVYSFDLLAGHTCPGAKDCKSQVVLQEGKRKIQDGPGCQFRCFAASMEVRLPAVYALHKHNTDVLRGLGSQGKIYSQLSRDLPPDCGILRFHVSGDFETLPYFRAAYRLAKSRPDVLFYCYTKSLKYLAKLDCEDLSIGRILPNFRVTGSVGGRYDDMLGPLGLRTATVVFDHDTLTNLPLDQDDSHAATEGGDFRLLLHATQPAGSTAAKALVTLKKGGV